MNSCLSNESQTLDPWPELTPDSSFDFQFENNFTPSPQEFQPLPDKEVYLYRLGKCPVLLHNTIVLGNHRIGLHYIIKCEFVI